MNKYNSIAIFSSRVARDLIQKGHELNDIRPNKEMRIKTVFYFTDTKGLRRYLESKHNIVLN